MNKEVVVRVKGTQFADEANEIETVCDGEFYEVKDALYVVYEECMEGFDQPVINRIKIKQNEITVTKKGPYQVQMIFEQGVKNRTQYFTPYGQILMDIDTDSLDLNVSDEEIKIFIKYGLSANEQYVSDCEIDINITQKK